MHCHDRVFKSVTVLGEAGETLYTITRKGAGSLTWRRSITDSSDIHLFDLRHFGYAMKNKWAVETPGRREIATLHHVNGRDEKSSGNQNRSDLDMTAKNRFDKEEEGEGEGEEVRLEMRQVDRSGITTLVYVGDEMVAEIRVVEENDVVDLRGRDRSVWKARVAGGVDLAVVSIHAWILMGFADLWVDCFCYALSG